MLLIIPYRFVLGCLHASPPQSQLTLNSPNQLDSRMVPETAWLAPTPPSMATRKTCTTVSANTLIRGRKVRRTEH